MRSYPETGRSGGSGFSNPVRAGVRACHEVRGRPHPAEAARQRAPACRGAARACQGDTQTECGLARGVAGGFSV
jgi:hypothetical protein